MRQRSAAPMLVLLWACTSETGDTDPPKLPPAKAQSVEVISMSPTEHLVRASMVLRGTRPTRDELLAVSADPGALEAIVDTYLISENFGRAIRDLHNEALLLRTDWAYYPAGFAQVAPLEDVDVPTINRSVQEAPLKLIEHVVMNDLPYSQIVTSDFTLADRIVATVWNLAYQQGGAEWQKTRWEDGRGNSGILTDSWLYVRWQSTPSNANRGRANALSRALLCYDFLSRDVDLDTSVNAADPNAVQNAVVDNPACASCHQALDPFAAFMKDILFLIVPEDTVEHPTYPMMSMWLPGMFEKYLDIEMREPSLFGRQGETLSDLGRLIAEDPRFSLCAAKRFYSYFNHVDVDDVPLARAAELQETFIESGLNAKALAKAIVLGDDFRASHTKTELGAEELLGLRHARPDELATMFEDLTGFVWETDLSAYTNGEIGRIELSRDSFLGYSVLGGGIDSQYVTRYGFSDSATTSLFLKTFAASAAQWVVDRDFEVTDPNGRRLFQQTAAVTDDANLRGQLQALHARVWGELVPEDSAEIAASVELWQSALAASGDPKRAWKTLLTAMFQDIRIAYY